MTNIANWKITMFNGKIHELNGHFQVRQLLVITRGQPNSGIISGIMNLTSEQTTSRHDFFCMKFAEICSSICWCGQHWLYPGLLWAGALGWLVCWQSCSRSPIISGCCWEICLWFNIMEYKVNNTKTVYLNIHAVIPTNFSNYSKCMVCTLSFSCIYS